MQTAHRGQGYGPLYPAGLRSKGHCIGGREAVVSVPWRATSRLLLNLSMSEIAIFPQPLKRLPVKSQSIQSVPMKFVLPNKHLALQGRSE